ncbi:MAG: endolytic transglycosylase MltG [Elusimicrobia bacterium]|nr:endolytic transglycosylase MltG [Elusimicrobiota bacterium]
MVLAALVAAAWFFRSGSVVEVEIPAGQSAGEIASLLRRYGVLSYSQGFKALASLTGLDRDLKPGVYRLRRHMTSIDALLRLTRYKPEYAKIVVPEGFCARQIAERLEANGVTSAGAFMEYAQAHRLEGYLFPTTYYFNRGMKAEDVAQHMVREFRKVVEPDARAVVHRLNFDQIVILASILEREAVQAEEKPMIAAVYLNRLAKRKPLEADPTVQYALGHWKKGLTLKDLQVVSPYNTYAHYGLPPGPICSPGLDSIRAVLQPARTDAIYFVADNTGGHTFNATYEEHLKAKQKAKRERQRKSLP